MQGLVAQKFPLQLLLENTVLEMLIASQPAEMSVILSEIYLTIFFPEHPVKLLACLSTLVSHSAVRLN